MLFLPVGKSGLSQLDVLLREKGSEHGVKYFA